MNHNKGCVLIDCPVSEDVECNYVAMDFKGNINLFVQELKEDLPKEWLSRFNYGQLQKKQENKWYLPVVWNAKKAAPGLFPTWCTIDAQDEFAKILENTGKYKGFTD